MIDAIPQPTFAFGGPAASLCGKPLVFRPFYFIFSRARLCLATAITMTTTISYNNPCLYLTSVAHHRLPVFQTDKIKNIACKALAEARLSGKFAIFAYVLMPDHLHTITNGERKPSDVLRFINGIIARRVIEYLKANGYEQSLAKLRSDTRKGSRHSLWEQHPNVKLLTSESVFMQKVNYLHNNPVRAGLIERPEDYLWSSVRCWRRCERDDEPLKVDIDKIVWRQTSARAYK